MSKSKKVPTPPPLVSEKRQKELFGVKNEKTPEIFKKINELYECLIKDNEHEVVHKYLCCLVFCLYLGGD